MRVIRFFEEKQQINFLNCNSIDRWYDTCVTRQGAFNDVCSDKCDCGNINMDTLPSEWKGSTPPIYKCSSEVENPLYPFSKYEEETRYVTFNGKEYKTNEHRYNIVEELSKDCGWDDSQYDIIFSKEEKDTARFNSVPDEKEELNVKANMYCINLTRPIDNYSQVTFSGISKLHKMIDTSNLTDMSLMFNGCSSLTDLDTSKFITSKATDMSEMFQHCELLARLDLSSFDTSKVTNMQGMFYDCSSLASLDLTSFDTRQVTDMGFMFMFCGSLSSLNISSFITSKVTSMKRMFDRCSSLADLDVSKFNTSKVTNMQGMFNGCSSLIKLNLTNFDTSKVTDMGLMLYNCTSLETVNMSGLDLSNASHVNDVFGGCTSLKTIYFDNAKLSHMNQTLLEGCTSLETIYMRGCTNIAIDNIKAIIEANKLNAVVISE